MYTRGHSYFAFGKEQNGMPGGNDARGIAQMMRAGLYRPVHVKTLRSQKLRMLLTHRKLLQSKAIASGPNITAGPTRIASLNAACTANSPSPRLRM